MGTIKVKSAAKHIKGSQARINQYADMASDDNLSDKAYRAMQGKARHAGREIERTRFNLAHALAGEE